MASGSAYGYSAANQLSLVPVINSFPARAEPSTARAGPSMLTYDEIELRERKSNYLLDAPPIASAKTKRPAKRLPHQGCRNRVAKAVIDQAPTQADGAATPDDAGWDACVVTDVPEASGGVPSEVAVPSPLIAEGERLADGHPGRGRALVSPSCRCLLNRSRGAHGPQTCSEPEAPVASARHQDPRFARMMCCARRSICERWLRPSTRTRN